MFHVPCSMFHVPCSVALVWQVELMVAKNQAFMTEKAELKRQAQLAEQTEQELAKKSQVFQQTIQKLVSCFICRLAQQQSFFAPVQLKPGQSFCLPACLQSSTCYSWLSYSCFRVDASTNISNFVAALASSGCFQQHVRQPGGP